MHPDLVGKGRINGGGEIIMVSWVSSSTWVYQGTGIVVCSESRLYLVRSPIVVPDSVCLESVKVDVVVTP